MTEAMSTTKSNLLAGARDPRIRFTVNSPNLGMVNNWNFCLEQARGEYVKYSLGDDKLCHPQTLGKMAALLERHPSATLAASARVILDSWYGRHADLVTAATTAGKSSPAI